MNVTQEEERPLVNATGSGRVYQNVVVSSESKIKIQRSEGIYNIGLCFIVWALRNEDSFVLVKILSIPTCP